MTVQFIRLASQGLPVGAIRILPPATEAALEADGEVIYTTVPNTAGDDLPVRFDPTTGMIVMSDGGPIAAQVALQGMVSNAGNGAGLVQSTAYHFAGWAPGHIKTALALYDRSGQLRDAAFQASLTAANAWATDGLLTIANPAANSLLARIAPLDFNYTAGETLLVFWRGFATPEGADAALVGDIGDGSTTTRTGGFEVIVSTAGKLKLFCRDNAAGSYFSGTTTATAFEAATEHTIAICLDGATKTYCMWVDGVRDAAMVSNFATFSSGATIDTVGGKTVWVGGNGRVSAGVQEGVACQTRALHILRRTSGGIPTTIDLAVANLHRDSQRLLSAAEY